MQILDTKPISNFSSIAIVVSRYNHGITQKLLDGALERLRELAFPAEELTVVWVPGAVEIPLAAQRLAQTEKYEAIICLGAVIYGESRHFDYVCDQVSQGCQNVALHHDIPVIFGVLTTLNEAQAEDRAGGKKGNVGRDAVDTMVQYLSVLRQI